MNGWLSGMPKPTARHGAGHARAARPIAPEANMNARNPSVKTSSVRDIVAQPMRYSNNPIVVGDITNATGVAIGPGARASVAQMRNGTSDEVAFLNPITGLGTAFKKIVGQAKAEREAKRHDRS
jgi:hypothetical protein